MSKRDMTMEEAADLATNDLTKEDLDIPDDLIASAKRIIGVPDGFDFPRVTKVAGVIETGNASNDQIDSFLEQLKT